MDKCSVRGVKKLTAWALNKLCAFKCLTLNDS